MPFKVKGALRNNHNICSAALLTEPLNTIKHCSSLLRINDLFVRCRLFNHFTRPATLCPPKPHEFQAGVFVYNIPVSER